MNTKERVKMVRAMEFIVRQLNDEDILDTWLVLGVADGDDYSEDEYIAEVYCDDETFSELMQLFLRLMHRAWKSGGLYCDNVLSKFDVLES